MRNVYSGDHLPDYFLSIPKKVTFGEDSFRPRCRAADQMMLCRKADFRPKISPQASRKMFQMAHNIDAVAAKKTKDNESWDTGRGRRFAKS